MPSLKLKVDEFSLTISPCIVRIWISAVLENTPDLHSAYIVGFLIFSDHLYYDTLLV